VKPQEYSFPTERYLLVGKVKKAHGMAGEVSILVFSARTEDFHLFSQLVLVDRNGRLSRPLNLEQCRVHGQDSVLARFSEIANRDDAEDIRGAGVLIEHDALPQLGEGEYYWYQMYGKVVVDLQGKRLGHVVSLFHNGAQDVLVVKENEGSEEILIPITGKIVVAEKQDRLIVDPPPGLLDLNRG
jgi:16S rRNA processing protein RimM